MTDECDDKHMLRFQQLIGILRWDVEFGKINIQMEVSLISQYQASTREGHMEALYLVFHFMSNSFKKRLVMDPHEPNVDKIDFNSYADWNEFYRDMLE